MSHFPGYYCYIADKIKNDRMKMPIYNQCIIALNQEWPAGRGGSPVGQVCVLHTDPRASWGVSSDLFILFTLYYLY